MAAKRLRDSTKIVPVAMAATTSAMLPVTRAGATRAASTAPGMCFSQAAAKPSRGRRSASNSPLALTAMVASAMPRMAMTASGEVYTLADLQDGAGHAADDAADQNMPIAFDKMRGGDGGERRDQPGHEIGLAFPHAQQQRQERRGKGEIEPPARRIVDGRAQAVTDDIGAHPRNPGKHAAAHEKGDGTAAA